MKLFALIAALALAGCTTTPDANNPEWHGPDTSQKFDAEGNPNFGPKR